MGNGNFVRRNELTFNNISEFIGLLKYCEENKYKAYGDSSQQENKEDWCDTETLEEAVELLTFGSQKLYDEFKKLDNIKVEQQTKISKSILSVQGYQVVIPLHLKGVPQNMVNRKIAISNKIVNIFYEVKAPHWVKQSDIIATTTKVLERVIKLEKMGYRVNLYVLAIYDDVGKRFGFSLRIKTDKELFSYKKMLFPLISPSMLRRILFRVKEIMFKDWIGCGYGSANFKESTIIDFIKKHYSNVKSYEVWDYTGLKLKK